MEAGNQEELLIRFLGELVSLSDSIQMVFRNFKIEAMGPQFLRANYEALPKECYEMRLEIKAVTYHELSIRQEGEGFVAHIIFDV